MKRESARNSVHSKQVAERLNGISIKRQEIIRPIFERPRAFVLSNVRSMAERLGTDPATVIRIVRGLGFPGFREFQHYLHELSLAFATSVDTMERAAPASGIAGHIADSVELDFKNLQALQNTLDTKRLAASAKRFYGARRIVVMASDLAAVLAEYFEYHLVLLGMDAFAATTGGKIVHLTRNLKEKDVVVAISFRRGLRPTVEGLQSARRCGAHCIAITDTLLSPLARLSHETYLAGIGSNSFGASYAAPMALLNALLGAIGQHRRSLTIRIAKEISEEQSSASRWVHD